MELEHGERLRLVLLTHQAARLPITGVAVAIVKPGRSFAYPAVVATQLSRILLEAGDAVPAIVPT